MTTARQLFDLQQLDLELDQYRGRVDTIAHELSDRSRLENLAAEVEALKGPLMEMRTAYGLREMDTQAIRQKLEEEEAKLYGGTVTNVRELEALQKETGLLREQLKGLDEQLLESMEAIEQVQGQLQALEEELAQAQHAKERDQSHLLEEKEHLTEKIGRMVREREDLAANVHQVELRRYETLRHTKGGVAIAKVERGLCRGCRMTLPTYQLQRARAGRETVLCSTCGRILFVS